MEIVLIKASQGSDFKSYKKYVGSPLQMLFSDKELFTLITQQRQLKELN